MGNAASGSPLADARAYIHNSTVALPCPACLTAGFIPPQFRRITAAEAHASLALCGIRDQSGGLGGLGPVDGLDDGLFELWTTRRGITPLHLRRILAASLGTEAADWAWSPDGDHWQPVAENLTVTGGVFSGDAPARINVAILRDCAALHALRPPSPWSPAAHARYPAGFRAALRTWLLCLARIAASEPEPDTDTDTDNGNDNGNGNGNDSESARCGRVLREAANVARVARALASLCGLSS